jgi:hypothetical protein
MLTGCQDSQADQRRLPIVVDFLGSESQRLLEAALAIAPFFANAIKNRSHLGP